MESKFINLNGKKLHYVSYVKNPNEKPVCLFIHGASPQSQHADFWKPILPQILNHCRPVLLDGYGHGQSDKPEATELLNTDKILEIYTGFIHAILKDEQIDKFALIGRSLGGMIVHSLAKLFEDKLIGIGLIAPARAGNTEKTLKDFSKNVSVLWDSEDPAVAFNSYITIEKIVNQAKLFVIGTKIIFKTTIEQPRRSDSQPSHVSELQYPELFEKFLRSIVN